LPPDAEAEKQRCKARAIASMKERRGEVEAQVEAEVDLFALLQQSITVPPPTLPLEAEA